MKSFLGCLLVTLITSLSAHAGIIIQPYVGYESGALKQDGQADIKTTGSFYGARLGYKFLGIMMGLDYMTGSEKADQNGAKDDYKPTDYGAFLGYEFPAVIQIYGTFFTNSSTKISPGTYPSDFTGRGVRFGIG